VGDKGAEMGRKRPYAEASYGSIGGSHLALASLSGKWDYDVKSAGYLVQKRADRLGVKGLAKNLHRGKRINRFLDSDEDRGHVCKRGVCYRNEFVIT
jgi:hypothetical protein